MQKLISVNPTVLTTIPPTTNPTTTVTEAVAAKTTQPSMSGIQALAAAAAATQKITVSPAQIKVG